MRRNQDSAYMRRALEIARRHAEGDPAAQDGALLLGEPSLPFELRIARLRLPRRHVAARRDLDDLPAAAATDAAVELRTGIHDRYLRIVLDWAVPIGFETAGAGRRWRIVCGAGRRPAIRWPPYGTAPGSSVDLGDRAFPITTGC